MLKRVICWLIGHPSSVWISEAWLWNEEFGTYRVNTLTCPRCRAVEEIRSETTAAREPRPE